jgi:hypothetical protein
VRTLHTLLAIIDGIDLKALCSQVLRNLGAQLKIIIY